VLKFDTMPNGNYAYAQHRSRSPHETRLARNNLAGGRLVGAPVHCVVPPLPCGLALRGLVHSLHWAAVEKCREPVAVGESEQIDTRGSAKFESAAARQRS